MVVVKDANVYHHATNGALSKSYDFWTVIPKNSVGQGAAPAMGFTLSQRNNQFGAAPAWLRMAEEAFVRFKNGGKRLPTGYKKPSTGKGVIDPSGKLYTRTRPDRSTDAVREGDVGPYKSGDGHLYKAKLAPGTSTRPAAWAAAAGGAPAYYETDPAPHVQQRQNRDHMNNQKSLEERQLDPRKGIAVTIPQWIHMNGYTFGVKAVKPKSGQPTLTRSQWISQNAEAALFKEIYQELRLYADSNQLSFEIVGSYRYLYKLSVETTHYTPTTQLDALVMHYLNLAV